MPETENIYISNTLKWIETVVVGCNFCPFAASVLHRKTIHFQVEESKDLSVCLTAFAAAMELLDQQENIATSFLIFPKSFANFNDYLNLVELSEKLLQKNGKEGIYQVASFHPNYRFANSSPSDAANYTNRSVYPMLHLLREDSVEKALKNYPDPETIPEKNILFARTKGLVYMKMLLENCQ